MINPFCSYVSFIQTFFIHLQYMQDTVHEYSVTRVVITYKPVFQTTFKRLADSLFLWESPAGRFTASTVTVNKVSARCFYVGL
jgi:hypothetical protein